MFTELKGKDYYERLRYVNLWTLEERTNRWDLIEVSRCTKDLPTHICELFTQGLNFKRTRGHTLKLEKPG